MPGSAHYERANESLSVYGEHLVGIDNPDPYEGPISGVVNDRTRALIGTWLDADLRCPVVIEAWKKRDKADDLFTEPYGLPDSDNLWRPHQLTDTAPRMYARDFSGRWTLPAGSPRDLDRFVDGEWTRSKKVAAYRGPIVGEGRETWHECEVTPQTLVDLPPEALGAEAASTFRVVRAVAEVECLGFFDCVQCWDGGVLSLGLCHWTIALVNLREDAELPALLAYMRGLGGEYADAYDACFSDFGLSSVETWPEGTSQTGTACWNSLQRKYTSPIAIEDDTGRAVKVDVFDDDVLEWFRHWHWMHRFAMAARTLEPLRRAMWVMARIRLRDILNAEWQPQLLTRDDHGNPVHATIGDIFTSERTVALLLRWHVNAPAGLFPLPGLLPAVPADWGDPRDWDDAKELALHDQVLANGVARGEPLASTLEKVDDWGGNGPNWVQKEFWLLDYEAVYNTPRFIGLVNEVTGPGEPTTIVVDVDFRHGKPGFTPTLDCVLGSGPVTTQVLELREDGLWDLTLTPAFGATGDSGITLVANNGWEVGSDSFWLTVDGLARPFDDRPPVAVPSTTGLSIRRNSFHGLWDDLP